jgi:hypothetical protein
LNSLVRSRSLLALLGFAALSACGGGNDGGTAQPTATVSTRTLAFQATGPDDATPAAQSFTATFSSGTVFVAAVPEGSAIDHVSYTLSGNTAVVTVFPKSPTVLGPGKFTGAVSVFGQVCADAACSRLVSGNTEQVTISYPIPEIVRDIAPYVAEANTTNAVILRGRGFQTATIQAVSFGGIPATSFAVTGDTQIDAVAPALPAGRYPVQIQANDSAGVLSLATLAVVAPPAFAATTLAYPTAAPTLRRLAYDAERSALVLAVDTSGGQLLQIAKSGATWGTPAITPISGLQDVTLQLDGQKLLAVTDGGVVPVDAATLVAGTALPLAGLASGTTLKYIAMANDGQALLTSTAGANTSSPVYAFSPRTQLFSTSSLSANNGLPVAAGNGAQVVIVQQDSTGATTPALYQLVAATGSLSTVALGINRNAVLPAIDRTGSRIVLNGLGVYDATFGLIGALPSTTLAAVPSPDGSRVYAYDSASAGIVTYDATTAVATSTTVLPVLGTTIALSGDPGSGVQMVITPFGNGLILAGSQQIVVVPVTP